MQSSYPEVPVVIEEVPVPGYPIESVDNALRLLLLLGEQQEIRLTEASNYLEVASSTAHRVLAMLQYRGFVRQNPLTKAYGPGPALTAIAHSVRGRFDINRSARPFMHALNNQLNESISLGALEGANVRFLESIESSHTIRVASRVGFTMPAHCSSLGKVLLAQLDTEEVLRIYPSQSLVALTSKSISDRDELLSSLEKIRQRGYATNREESEENLASVAVAVPTNLRGMRIGLSAAAPVHRFPAKRTNSYVTALKEAAVGLAQAIG